MNEYFEEWAKREGYDLSRHETGFYLIRSTHNARKAFEEGAKWYVAEEARCKAKELV